MAHTIMEYKNWYKNVRLKKFDYSSGWFFITNKSDFAQNYFIGKIRNLVKEELINLSGKINGVEIDYFHIMPNHIHAILIFDNAQLPLFEFWRRYKAITTLKAKRIGFPGKSLWQKNYYEHIIRNEYALQRIREYIENNPLKENLPLEEIYQHITHVR